MTEYSRSQKLGVQRKKKNFRSLNVPRFFFLSREEQCAGRTYVIHTSLFFFFVFPAVASVQCVTLVSFFFFFLGQLFVANEVFPSWGHGIGQCDSHHYHIGTLPVSNKLVIEIRDVRYHYEQQEEREVIPVRFLSVYKNI